MAHIYDINITDNGGIPVADDKTCDDYKNVHGSHEPNSVKFDNQTGKTVYLTGGTNWSTFFSATSPVTLNTGSQKFILNLATSAPFPSDIDCVLSYTPPESDEIDPGEDNPSFTITMNA